MATSSSYRILNALFTLTTRGFTVFLDIPPIQGDMQLEAQLVSNGLYCGNPSGYEDPRRETLEPGADEWVLLLQFDSDSRIDVMWGDLGMLYFWIRKSDLAERRFDRTWMTVQCG
jgi:uncharacterized protein YwqG